MSTEDVSDEDAMGLLRAFSSVKTPDGPPLQPSPPEDPACRERYDALMRRLLAEHANAAHEALRDVLRHTPKDPKP